MAGMSTHNKHLLGEKSVPENNDWLLPLPPDSSRQVCIIINH
jgi:hypothetical protein